jgi:hypothetical protein
VDNRLHVVEQAVEDLDRALELSRLLPQRQAVLLDEGEIDMTLDAESLGKSEI